MELIYVRTTSLLKFLYIQNFEIYTIWSNREDRFGRDLISMSFQHTATKKLEKPSGGLNKSIYISIFHTFLFSLFLLLTVIGADIGSEEATVTSGALSLLVEQHF